MKLFIAVFICKLAYFIGSRIGKGSSLPGKAALWLCPDVLKHLKLPGIIIAVTGSNGKSSTAEMTAQILRGCGLNTGYNHEGSNQTEGIATLLLRKSTFRGIVRCDALVLECDERYAGRIFAQAKPGVLLITNLCRDQLTRNGHHEFISSCLRDAVNTAGESTVLVLNADDPFTAALNKDLRTESGKLKIISNKNKAMFFGISSGGTPADYRAGMYDDGAFCPLCKERMSYEYRVAAHFGGYNCSACGFHRPEPDYEVSGNDAPSLNGAYNLAAAVTAAAAAGINTEEAVRYLSGYELKGGRTMKIPAGRKNVMLQICKHENSLAYDRCFNWITQRSRECSVVIMVDSISRKYYTSETSWLWDINADILSNDCVKEIILTGRYRGELMMRFLMSDVSADKYRPLEDTAMLRRYMEECSTEDIYVVTCFADKKKLLKELKVKKDHYA